jgi:threonine/homoserine/homoserine lactone efflux protein
MADMLGHIFACAIGVAVSPVPIVAVILMLFSRHARRNGLLFLAGWVLGLIVMTAFVLLLPDGFEHSAVSFLASVSSAFQLVVGLLFVVVAFAVWHGRPNPGEERPLPPWTERIDGFSALRALALALALAVINPKNLVLALAVTLDIAGADLPARQARLALALFWTVGSLTIAAPVIYHLIAGRQAERRLQEWKTWLIQNNATIMFVLLLVVGTVLAGRGLGGLI